MKSTRTVLGRRVAMAIALLAAGGILAAMHLGVFDSDDEPPVPKKIGPRAAAMADPATTEATETRPQVTTDIFAIRTWAPPPPPPTKPAPPPPPQAPPLPFKFLGQIDDGPQGRVFMLAYGERVVAATPGTAIDERYRLEKFEGGQLHFLYLPMNAHQTLSVGNSL